VSQFKKYYWFIFLSCILIIVGFLDIFSTQICLYYHIGYEGNPFVAPYSNDITKMIISRLLAIAVILSVIKINPAYLIAVSNAEPSWYKTHPYTLEYILIITIIVIWSVVVVSNSRLIFTNIPMEHLVGDLLLLIKRGLL
jgi:hypothetical protein